MRTSLFTSHFNIRKWAWWQLPNRLRWYVAVVPLIAVGLTVLAVAHIAWRAEDIVAYLLLLGCAVISVAATPRSAYVEGTIALDFIPVWILPVAILLPPGYAMLMPMPLYALTQWRVHRGILHRKVFTASAIALGYGAASTVFRLFPASVAGQHIGFGRHALTWAALAAGCELLVARWHNGLLLTAIKLSSPSTHVLRLEFARETLLANLSESDLGILITCVVAASPWLSIFAVPTIILARRFMMHAQLVEQTRMDAKTGLLNSSAWEREASIEVQRAVRAGTSVALALIDIDHFKRVNDTHGHLVGDVVLRAVTDAIRAHLRSYDLAGRFGGEEFVVLLPNAQEADAVRIAERLRTHVAAMAIPVAQESADVGQRPTPGEPEQACPEQARASEEAEPKAPKPPPEVRLTISIGVVAMDDSRRELGDLMAAADAALYQAKQTGRNRTRVMPSIAPPAARAAPAITPDSPVHARR